MAAAGTDAMKTIDASTWHKRNLWRHPSGELCVRPGFRRVYTVTASREIVGGFSVHNSYVDEVWHYVFDVATSGRLDLKLRVLDDNFDTVQVLSINADMRPRVITHAIVEGLGLICSPDFPTLFFVVGNTVRIAETVESDNSLTTALAVPRGICSVFENRVAIADGRSVFFSDPVAATGGDVRTFVAQNQNQRPGRVYGLHQGAGGMLVAVTSEGVWGLPADAAAVGIVGTNGTGWSFLSHARAFSFASSCAHRGRIWALTRDGMALVDTETTDEARPSDPLMPRAIGTRIAPDDYRTGRMFALDEGPAIALDTEAALLRTDLARSFSSWWTSGFLDDARAVGVLRDLDGTEMLLLGSGAFAMAGDIDGELALTSETDEVTGALFGVVPVPPGESWQVRSIDAGAAVGGGTDDFGVALRGRLKETTLPVETSGFVIGTDAWESTTKKLQTTPVQYARADFGAGGANGVARNDDVGIEIAVTGCTNRVASQLSVDVAKQAPFRPGKVF